MRPRFTQIVEGLPPSVPFVGPERQERQRGRLFRARIGANESVFGPSPRAVAAMASAAADGWMYGDPDNHDLRLALAAHHGIDGSRLVIGEGIDGLLGLTVRLFVEPGDRVVTSAGAYPTFNYHVAGFGGVLQTVPYRDDHEDPVALAQRVAETGARLVYFANPDNPMGTWWPAADVMAFHAALPESCVLCLDEAYAEFAPSAALPPLDWTAPNLLRFRTFSKARGLAGLRVGYAIGDPDVAAGYDRIRNHFGMTRVAQAGAIGALADPGHLDAVVAAVAAARARIAEIAAASGLSVVPSATNFVAVDCGRDGDHARRVLGGLLERDVFVRMPGVAPLDRCIRISAGTAADLDLVAEVLPKALAAASELA